MPTLRPLLILLFSALVFTACNNKVDSTRITYVNRLAEPVTLHIYSSLDAYVAGTSPLLRKTIPASDKIFITTKELPTNKTYYADWFTDDFGYHNWFNDKYPNGFTRVAFTPRMGDNTYYTAVENKSLSRAAFINGNEPSTDWLAVDAYQYSASTGYVSVWQGMDNNERHQSIVVNKDFTASYSYNDKYGAPHTDVLNFKVHTTPVAYIEFFDESGASLGSMVSGTLPTGAPPDYQSNSVDTIMALLPNSELKFMMVRK